MRKPINQSRSAFLTSVLVVCVSVFFLLLGCGAQAAAGPVAPSDAASVRGNGYCGSCIHLDPALELARSAGTRLIVVVDSSSVDLSVLQISDTVGQSTGCL